MNKYTLPPWSLGILPTTLKPFKWAVGVSIVLSLLSTAIGLMVANRFKLIIDNYQDLHLQNTLIVLGSLFLISELSGFLMRRYSEGVVIKYRDHVRLYTFSAIRNAINVFRNDEKKLMASVNEYLQTTSYLSSQIMFSLPVQIFNFFAAMVIIYNISPVVALLNVILLVIFVVVAYYLNRAYVEANKPYSNESIDFERNIVSLYESIDFLARNKHISNLAANMQSKWEKYDYVKMLHARRWFVQLMPFRVLYLITLGIYLRNVQLGVSTIGQVVLIQWYYSVIVGVFIYTSEFFTNLAKQKAVSVQAHKKILNLTNEILGSSEIGIPAGDCLIRTGNGTGKTTALYQRIKELKDEGIRVSSYISGVVPYGLPEGMSSGQLQRHLVNATAEKRALVYVFDEPCSHTDSTEWFDALLHELKADFPNCHIIVSSHDDLKYPFKHILTDKENKL